MGARNFYCYHNKVLGRVCGGQEMDFRLSFSDHHGGMRLNPAVAVLASVKIKAFVYNIMRSNSFSISVDEFKLFHSIDRSLYSLLVNELLRDPMESIQIMALWIWLERAGFRNVVVKILSLPHILINELADEAVTCLKFINDTHFAFLAEGSEIPLTHSLMKEEISLQFFQENRVDAMKGIGKAMNEVCLKALTDIMDMAMKRNATPSLLQSHMTTSPTVDQSFVQSHSHLGFVGESSNARTPGNGTPRDNRTMFVTFSKGYPVTEWEVRESFSRNFGDCVESFYMQEVRPDEQALYARIVFHSPLIVDYILNGMTKAKFTINGKHVWMRKFVPKRACPSLPSLLPNLPRAI